MVVGVCEANGWGGAYQQPWRTGPREPRSARGQPSMAARAAVAGLAHAFMLPQRDGWNIGIMATSPIEVLWADDSPMHFERGAIAAGVGGVVYIVVHLHAHDAGARVGEAQRIARNVTALTAAGRPVVVMGDFNTLSPLDADWHVAEDFVGCVRGSRAMHVCISRMGRPYGLKFDYQCYASRDGMSACPCTGTSTTRARRRTCARST